MIRLNCFFKADCQDCFDAALEAAKALAEKSRKHSATPEFGENVGIIQSKGLLKLESFNF